MAGPHVCDANQALQAADCARALYTAARAAGAGSRQLVRAAVRGFVRRHRRDRSYLAWVLRCARTSSALAVALLGLAAEPASARTALFLDRTGSGNPLGVLTNQPANYITTCNLDGDRDLDVVIDGRARYFANTGTVTTPAFIERTGSANPFNGLGTGFGLAFSDLDGDGDLDLVSGTRTNDGRLLYFENTGNAASPSFVQRTGSANPFDGVNAGTHAPQFADFDFDGDLDLVGGSFGGGFQYSYLAYVENTGTPTRPAMVARTNAASPFDGYVSDETRGTPAIGDFDADGDPDVILSLGFGPLHYLENVARRMRSPQFAYHFPTLADVGSNARPALADLDGDGDLDLLAGAADGTFSYFAILTGYEQVFPGNRGIEARTGAANPLNGVDVGADAAPAFADLDGDGDLDLIASGSGYYGTLTTYYVNTGDATHPHFTAFTGNATTLLGACRFYSRVPALGDLDGDGDLDLVAAAYMGSTQVILCENTGGPAIPAFRVSSSPFAGDWPFVGAPALGDIDRDGDLDAFLGYDDGTFRYVENAVVRPIRMSSTRSSAHPTRSRARAEASTRRLRWPISTPTATGTSSPAAARATCASTRTRATPIRRGSLRAPAPPTRSRPRSSAPTRRPRSAISTRTATSTWSWSTTRAPSARSTTTRTRAARSLRRLRCGPERRIHSPGRIQGAAAHRRLATSTSTAISI